MGALERDLPYIYTVVMRYREQPRSSPSSCLDNTTRLIFPSFFLITLIMKIAITGCNGEVGRRVVLWVLKEGHTVVGADHVVAQDTDFYNNPAFSFHQVDLRDFDTALKVIEGCDAIIQLAAWVHPMDGKAKVHNE